MSTISSAIHSALHDCLNVQPHEKVLILADTPHNELGYQFYMETKSLTEYPYLLLLPEIKNHGYEPPKTAANMMAKSDAIVVLTKKSLSHTVARRRACLRGARVASLPNIKPESLIRTLTGNYKQMINKSRKLADILTIGRKAHLTNPAGTNITFSLAKMKGYADTGIIHEPGQFSNLPAGEGCIAPVQGSAQGTLMIDGSFHGIGLLKTPIRIGVKDGQAVRISGGNEVDVIRKILRPFGKEGRNIAEIGVGTNSKAQVCGSILEDEKALGTVHVALGDNISFGGKVSVGCHLDGILLNPTLVIDGKTIIEDGVLQV